MFWAVSTALGLVFMFCASGLVFGCAECVGSRFHILRARTRFRRYRGHQVPFSAVRSASGLDFMFCAIGLVLSGTEGVGSRFHVLRSWTRFRRYRGCRFPFSCFLRSDSFSVLSKPLDPDFMFCAPELVFGGTKGVGSRFHVLRARTSFHWYQGRRVPFSCFALPDSFPAVPSASGTVSMFCAPGHVFGDTEGVNSYFHVLHALTCFWRNQGRRLPFSCFVFPDSFLVVLRESGHVFTFSYFDLSSVPRVPGPVFMFCASGLVFGDTEGIRSSFHVLRSRVSFRWFGGRRVLISCFAQLDSFSAVPRASGLVFIFCALRLVSGGTESVGSRFHVFRRCRGRGVSFSCFALPDPFSAVLRASGPFFMFCTPRSIFGGTEGVGSRFHVLLFRTRFRRYRGFRVPFSCFAGLDSFLAVPRASGLIFMFCAP
jgi:hypothetical protein